MPTQLQVRRDTAANWSATNPTPAQGEPCYETDTGVLKFGDGSTAYNSLAEFGGTVDTVFGRTGAVAAAASDYDASQVDNDSTVAGAFVDDALDTLAGAITTLDGGKSDTGHGHTLSDISDAGALAPLDTIDTAQIDDEAVTLAKLAPMATASLIGRDTAGTGDPEVLSAADARTLLNVEDGATADQSDAEIETAYNNQVDVVTQPEAEAGTVTDVRRWTPERIKQAIAALGAGGPTQATQAAIEAETDEDTYIPPDLLRHHPGVAKAWVRFNGTGTIAINGSYNVASITDIGTGNYQINVDDDFSAADYCLLASAANNGTRNYTDCASNAANTAGVLRVITSNQSGTLADSDLVCAAAFGDQ